LFFEPTSWHHHAAPAGGTNRTNISAQSDHTPLKPAARMGFAQPYDVIQANIHLSFLDNTGLTYPNQKQSFLSLSQTHPIGKQSLFNRFALILAGIWLFEYNLTGRFLLSSVVLFSLKLE
jgi:hypothetical protein